MPGVTTKIEETVITGDELLVQVPNIKHGDVDADTLSLVVNDEEISEDEVDFTIDVSKETICIKNLTDHDWEVDDVVTLAWHKIGELNNA